MQDFVVEIRLQSDLILNHTTTLDAVLGGILAAKAQEGEDLNGLSKLVGIIDRDKNGVPMASEIILDDDQRGRAIFTAATKFPRSLGDKVVIDGLKINRRNQYGSKLSAMRTINSRTVRFYGRGDIDKVSAILAQTQSIGAKRSVGYGEIESFEVIPTTFDGDIPGIVHGGKLVRPVPRDLVGDYGVQTGFVTREGRYENPYAPMFYHQYPPEIIARPETDFLVYRDL